MIKSKLKFSPHKYVLYLLLYEDYLKWKYLPTFHYYSFLRVNWHVQVSKIYVSYVDNTLIRNIVLIHFKLTLWFLHLLKTLRYQKFSGIFRGIELAYNIGLSYVSKLKSKESTSKRKQQFTTKQKLKNRCQISIPKLRTLMLEAKFCNDL